MKERKDGGEEKKKKERGEKRGFLFFPIFPHFTYIFPFFFSFLFPPHHPERAERERRRAAADNRGGEKKKERVYNNGYKKKISNIRKSLHKKCEQYLLEIWSVSSNQRGLWFLLAIR